jgi:hypothetical protein
LLAHIKIVATILPTALFLNLGTTQPPRRTVLLSLNRAALESLRNAKVSAPVAARTMAILETCIYDAWAAYDQSAVGTQVGGALRRPASERTTVNKEKAISYAAYRVLVDLFPADANSVFKPLMFRLGYDPNDSSIDIETPAGIGNVACDAVLESRHHDKSNQLGDLSAGPYSDWTHFRPVNMPASIPISLPSTHPVDMNHWQPLTFVNSTGGLVTQMFADAHWCFVTPFALSAGDELRSLAKSAPPPAYGSKEYQAQAEELVRLSAGLSDEQKMLAEFWSNPESESAPIRLNELAQWVSARDHHSLDDDVKMFFMLNNALLDASIAVWDLKREFNSVRPITAIAVMFNGKKIRAWGGPGKGAIEIDGSKWMPYQPATFPTPPSPDYVSETSTFAGAATSILKSWTGTDRLGYSLTFPARSSTIEPGTTPARQLSLHWDTFADALEAAGMAGRYAGTTFRQSDVLGRVLGRLAAEKAAARANAYFQGTAKPLNREQVADSH